MEYLIENIKKMNEIEPNWLVIVKEELDNDAVPQNRELAKKYNELWKNLRIALKRDRIRAEEVFGNQIGDKGNWILKSVEDSLETYFSFEQLRIIQERSLSEAEEILRYLFENVIIYYNPKFPRKYRDFGFETVSKFLDMTIGLNGLVDFYIRSRYTIDIIKEDLYTAYYAVSGNEEIVADRDVEIPGMEEQEAVSDVEKYVNWWQG